MTPTEAELSVLYYLMPAVGLACLITGVVLLLRPELVAARQKQLLKGFGVELQASVVTIIFVIGAALLGSTVYIYLSDVRANMTELRQTVSDLRSKLTNMPIDMPATFTLSDLDQGVMPSLDELQCKVIYSTGEVPLDVAKSAAIDGLRTTIHDVKRDSRADVYCLDQKTKFAWTSNVELFHLRVTLQRKKTPPVAQPH